MKVASRSAAIVAVKVVVALTRTGVHKDSAESSRHRNVVNRPNVGIGPFISEGQEHRLAGVSGQAQG